MKKRVISFLLTILLLFESGSIGAQTTTAVDLGLSVRWASCNVGASRPEESGKYFCWGEVSQKPRASWKNYKYGKLNAQKSDYYVTKYCLWPDYGLGIADYKSRLEENDDAAHVNLGGYWRMPTEREMTELMEKCIWTWCTINNAYGFRVTGPSGESIFLPAAGEYTDKVYYRGERGSYLTADAPTEFNSFVYIEPPFRDAYILWFTYYTSHYDVRKEMRHVGCSVRAVTDEKEKISLKEYLQNAYSNGEDIYSMLNNPETVSSFISINYEDQLHSLQDKMTYLNDIIDSVDDLKNDFENACITKDKKYVFTSKTPWIEYDAKDKERLVTLAATLIDKKDSLSGAIIKVERQQIIEGQKQTIEKNSSLIKRAVHNMAPGVYDSYLSLLNDADIPSHQEITEQNIEFFSKFINIQQIILANELGAILNKIDSTRQCILKHLDEINNQEIKTKFVRFDSVEKKSFSFKTIEEYESEVKHYREISEKYSAIQSSIELYAPVERNNTKIHKECKKNRILKAYSSVFESYEKEFIQFIPMLSNTSVFTKASAQLIQVQERVIQSIVDKPLNKGLNKELNGVTDVIQIKRIILDYSPTIEIKKQEQQKNASYLNAGYQFGTYSSVGASLGFYVSNVNIEASYGWGLKPSETLYWLNSEEYAPAVYTYSPSFVSAKIGYGIIIGRRLRLTPQIGGGAVLLNGKVLDPGYSDPKATKAYQLCALADLKIDFAITGGLGLFVSPTYYLPVTKSPLYTLLSGKSAMISGFGNGYRTNIGLSILF